MGSILSSPAGLRLPLLCQGEPLQPGGLQDQVGPLGSAGLTLLHYHGTVQVTCIPNLLWNFSTRETFLGHMTAMEIHEISNITKCVKPCHYTKYNVVRRNGLPIVKDAKGNFGLVLVAGSKVIRTEREQIIYGLQSFVADVGGTLGLFLGFSFLGFWDEICEAASRARNILRNK